MTGADSAVRDRYQAELAAEQDYVATLYVRLDQLRDEKRTQLSQVRRSGLQGSLQNQSERDAFATLYEDRLAQLSAVEDRLAFGRLDLDDDQTRYVGRIGLTDEEQQRLLVDWRAPEAASFYQATAFQRQSVRRRRHLLMSGRSVVGLEDDVLSEAEADDADSYSTVSAALLSAVTARRTGQMGDIVATIQSEQDAIIRADLPGVHVVQGGPGTGKTAVALHRAAYLLYTHRERLASAGVLLVGPSQAFMNYIDQVLPSLGETGVVMSSLARLMPGIDAVPETSRRAAAIKGRLDMAQVIADAVADRQRLIPAKRRVTVEGTTLTVRPGQIRRARDKARATGKPHNQARATFVKIMVKKLAEQMEEILQESSGGKNQADRSYLVEEVRQSREVRILLNLCWMPMTPEKLVSDLFSKPELLARLTPQLTDDERQLLRRDSDAPMTEADVPLLDEAAELLGEYDVARAAQAGAEKRQRERDVENARAALDNVQQVLEDIGVGGSLDAETVADAQAITPERRSAAERARSDRTWTFGHVVVDEAQELSPMQWRLLMRRCPMRSFTIVGDMAQASSAANNSSWGQILAPFVGERYTLNELTVNYRTPEKITSLATDVARGAGMTIATPEALRAGEHDPVVRTVTSAELADAVVEGITTDGALSPGGLIGVIVSTASYAAIRDKLAAVMPERLWTGGSARADRDVALVTAHQAKGLEYDAVILVEPHEMIHDADGVIGDLYVAMTRATQTLRVLASCPPAELPRGLRAVVTEED